MWHGSGGQSMQWENVVALDRGEPLKWSGASRRYVETDGGMPAIHLRGRAPPRRAPERRRMKGSGDLRSSRLRRANRRRWATPTSSAPACGRSYRPGTAEPARRLHVPSPTVARRRDHCAIVCRCLLPSFSPVLRLRLTACGAQSRLQNLLLGLALFLGGDLAALTCFL